MDLPERVVAGLSTSSSSSIKARMTSSPPELMESLSFSSFSSLSLLLYSSSSLSLSCKDSLSEDAIIPQRLRKTRLGYIVNPKGKRAQYYMSIMNEAYSKMRKNGESDQSFKNRFTAERSRQFDLLQSKESAYQNADGCSKRACEFLKPGYQLKPSDGRRLNSLVKEHQSMLGKLKSVVKALKEHDSMLFQSNGLILKQGEEFAHDFNVKQIKCVEAKVQKVTRDTETLEESKDSFRRIFKGLHGDRISKGRKKKENRRKSNARKKKRFENNVQRVYSICVGNPLGNYLPKCLLYPPCLAVPEGCIDVEKVSELLFDRDAAYIAQLLQGNHFSNAAGSRIITNLKPEVRDNVYCFMYPEEYAMSENDESDSSSSTSDEEELGNDDEEEHEQRRCTALT